MLDESRQSRRVFIKRAAAAAAGAAALRHGLWAHAAGGSRVVVARHSGIISEDGERDRAAMEALVDQAMAAFTGEAEPVAAWRSLFEPRDVVGLKVNCLAGYGLSTHPTLTAVVADRLQEAGVPAESIIIWERFDRELARGGYEPNRDGPGVRCLGTEDDLTDPMTHGQWTGRLTRIISDRVTALINLPILKDHNIAGVSVSLKNHFGSFDRPGDYHGSYADPYVADVNSLPAIREKQRLIICDATVGCYEGGPTFNFQYGFEPKAILVAADPVAMDHQGWRMVEAGRKENGLPPLEAAGRYPVHLDTAAARGLGTSDPGSTEIVNVDVA